jgi:hypothetical protein
MKTFEVVMRIRAECKSDAVEMIEDYVGEETDVKIISVKSVRGDM